MKPPLFVPRATYRRRRLTDAARLLPFVGVFLFALPMLWGRSGHSGAAAAREGLYLFAVWAGLIAVAALLGRRLAEPPEAGARGGAQGGEGEG